MYIRWFSSKAAALVLMWNLCTSIAMWSIDELIRPLYSGLSLSDESKTFAVVSATPFLILILSIPLSGWLADSRFGNYKMFTIGCILLFLGVVVVCSCILALDNLGQSLSQVSFVISAIFAPISNLLGFAGGGSCMVTLFQLGIDQMPDASSVDITSYIAWFFMSFFLGFWISNSSYQVLKMCAQSLISTQVSSLLPVACTCIVLCSFFIFGRKYLIIEPQTPQSLKTIIQVLKFAAKHKAPINRSALTYWEEDVPSRMDLGKSRYGGPFTTEQVEDVKIFFRLLLVFSPVWISMFSLNVHGSMQFLAHAVQVPGLTNSTCVYTTFSVFTYNPWWCGFVALLLYEFGVYPFVKYKLPNILKRLSFIILLIVVFNIVYFILVFIDFVHHNVQVSVGPSIVYTILSSSVYVHLVVCAVEFVCAQSPYNMRGFMFGFIIFTMFMFGYLGYLFSLFFTYLCHSMYCSLSQHSVMAVTGIVGFLLHCVLARWYKWRVRDEDYNPYPHVEAIYDRNLSRRDNLLSNTLS